MPSPSPDTFHPVMTKQLDCLAKRDLDGLMSNYADDAVLVRFDGSAAGLDEVRAGFKEYLAMEPEVVEIRDYAQTDDVIFYRASMKLGGQPEHAFGTLVLRDDKIWRQTAGFGV